MMHWCRTIALLFSVVAAMTPVIARADTLYKCEGPGGTVAYTNRKGSFNGCKAVASYVASKPAAGSAQATKVWDYQEPTNPKAQSSGVVSTAAMVGPAVALIDVTKPAEFAKPTAGAKVMTGPATSKIGPKIVRGAVYRVDRKDGITEYTNVRPPKGTFALLFSYISTCVACDINSTIDFSSTRLNLEAFKEEIAAAAADFAIDASLLRAVMHAESAFNPMALSSKGAQGLMQLMPGTASDLGVLDAFDTSQNIRGGAQYLAQMLKNFNGDERLATAAYNSGPGAVQKYGNVPPYAETQLYVERVAMLHERYRKAL